jgi:hypothetical protein
MIALRMVWRGFKNCTSAAVRASTQTARRLARCGLAAIE